MYNNSIEFKFLDIEMGTHIQIVMHYKTDRKWEKVSSELLTQKT